MTARSVDFIVIGSGIAGLTAARHLSHFGETLVITKNAVREGATQYAQGGIAAAMQADDATEHHFQDTINAGDELCDEAAVKVLVEEGPTRVQELIQLGASFDHIEGELQFTKEAAHSKRRILHAGDATGKEIEKTLGRRIVAEKKVIIKANTMVSGLIIQDGECVGCWVVEGKREVPVYAKAVVLATGGCGQLYSHNTNPPVATGDGIALAYQAGAVVQDMEFIQFHPTTLYLGDKKPISIFLISEAVRGEGALLRNVQGKRFMGDYHVDAELAPRDVVARSIFAEMTKTNAQHVYLDLSELDLDIPKRFPTIYKRCLEAGIDITRDFIPVAPAAHYMMGGVKTDIWGQTSIPRLFAGGEVACTGVHGANRLASNSLLDGLVFGHRIAEKAKDLGPIDPIILPAKRAPRAQQPLSKSRWLRAKQDLRDMMWVHVGIVRHRDGLQHMREFLKEHDWVGLYLGHKTEYKEIQHLFLIASLVTDAAIEREESRGSHFRKDFKEKSDEWRRHIELKQSRQFAHSD